MEKIINVSNIQRDNLAKYGQYARYKVEVDLLKNGRIIKKDEYLDEKQTEKDISLYVNDLRREKNQIHFKHLNKRILYNLVMVGLGFAELFAVLGVGNLLLAAGANKLLIGILGNIFIYLPIVSSLIYVNQRKFYYSKKEIEMLESLKKEIAKGDNILAEIYKMKQEGKMFEYDYQRLNKDFEDVRNKNKDRNYQMLLDQQKMKKETDSRINDKIEKKIEEMSKRSRSVNNVDFEFFKNATKGYAKPSLQKYSSFKDVGKDIIELVSEIREDKRREKYPENFVQRGERRRR